jgi:UDP-glucose 4-epimerase
LGLAHIKAVEYLLKKGKSEAINLGTGQGNSVLEIIRTVERLTDVKLSIQKGETRKGDPASLIASIKKAKKILNWEPKRSLDHSVVSLIKWYLENPRGWEY